MPPKAQATTAKMGKWDYITLKFLCRKENTQRVKEKSVELGEIFADHIHISEKGLVNKILR